MSNPYDFFVDEDKSRHLIGVLAVPHAVALDQILQSIRDQYALQREIKWNNVDRISLPVAASWIRVAGWHRGVKFACLPWPKGTRKGDVLLAFLLSFLERWSSRNEDGFYNSVAFLDFDQPDKQDRLHDHIRRRAGLLRCYVLDSKASNNLQLADLLLGCWATTGGAEVGVPDDLEAKWPEVEERLRKRMKLPTPVAMTSSEAKTYLRGFASRRFRRIRVT